jgi:hypothetical protein
MGLFRRKKKKNKPEEPAVQSGDELIAVLGAAVMASQANDHIAVIAAALAAYEGNDADRLYIRKIDRSAGVIPAWGVMGNREQIETRRF